MADLSRGSVERLRDCQVLPNGQGPSCDWDALCPVHGLPAAARLSDPDDTPCCPECGECRGATGGCDDAVWHPDGAPTCLAPYGVVCHLHH